MKPILSNEFLEEVTKRLPLSESQKEQLLENIPYLDEEKRVEYLGFLKDILLLEDERIRMQAMAKELGK